MNGRDLKVEIINTHPARAVREDFLEHMLK